MNIAIIMVMTKNDDIARAIMMLLLTMILTMPLMRRHGVGELF